MSDKKLPVVIRHLHRQPYLPIWQRMQQLTDTRHEQTNDEIWLVEHEPVFTQGQAGKEEHLLMPGDIPVVKVDRGGQVTYHGPGQMVVYLMIDIKRRKLGVRHLVNAMENAVIKVLADFHIQAEAKKDAPGVYVKDKKVCSVGLRIRRGCSFHGLALNVNMDLNPFTRINPCGYAGLEMVDTHTLNGPSTLAQTAPILVNQLLGELNITESINKEGFDE
ncbi:lipoyl(octanoyl) transferase LipB [Alteromonas sp. ASW11-130]|uniref:lipoyl(octanoyl) transferase LipB n=1 Tax=Alteromonas sp. ASW11-130 TaxID=3015775 RepID=UPI00224289D3|nr:lipoyl(octanoyl) transferase LipB [Alteromonas sp. ASW11-130]